MFNFSRSGQHIVDVFKTPTVVSRFCKVLLLFIVVQSGWVCGSLKHVCPKKMPVFIWAKSHFKNYFCKISTSLTIVCLCIVSLFIKNYLKWLYKNARISYLKWNITIDYTDFLWGKFICVVFFHTSEMIASKSSFQV